MVEVRPSPGSHRLIRSPRVRRLKVDETLAVEAAGQGALRDAVRKGVASSIGTRLLVQVVQLAGTVVLARLLLPEEYGTAAVALILTGLARIFTDPGVGYAVVQRQDLTQRDLATAFWLNSGSAVLLTALFSLLAWPIAALYDRPSLVPVMIVTSLGLGLSASTTHFALLERQFRFGTIGLIDTVANAIGLVVGVTAAALGAGALSVAYNFLTVSVVTTLCAWIVVGTVPTGRPSRDTLRFLWRFGRGVLGYNLLGFWSGNIDNLTISRVRGLAALGLYSRAYNLMLLPVFQIQAILGRVLFPALATLQHDLPRMRRVLERAIPILVCVGAPVSLGLAASAPSVVDVLYGARWSGTAPLLTALAFAGPPLVISGALNAGLQALGLTDLQFRRGLADLITTVVAVAIGIQFGALGVAVALAVRATLALPLTYSPCARTLALDTRAVLRATVGPLLASALMGAAVVSLRPLGAGWLTLVAQVGLGVVAYPLLLRLLAPTQFRELVDLARRRQSLA